MISHFFTAPFSRIIFTSPHSGTYRCSRWRWGRAIPSVTLFLSLTLPTPRHFERDRYSDWQCRRVALDRRRIIKKNKCKGMPGFHLILWL